jgi:hypothetical protein
MTPRYDTFDTPLGAFTIAIDARSRSTSQGGARTST